MHLETKGAWDYDLMRIYEIQTCAIKEEAEACVLRNRKYEAMLTFVASNDEMIDKIKEVTGNKYDCVNINDIIVSLSSMK